MARKSYTDEKLDDNSIERVIKYLSEKGSTKKNACAILNIAYNTSRLDKLIENYLLKKEEDKRRRAEKRGTPATEQEVNYVISEYLSGKPIESIAKTLSRGSAFCLAILDRYDVPKRTRNSDYFHPELLPDNLIKEDFKEGEVIFSARYNSLAKISKNVGKGVYRILVKKDDDAFYAYQPFWELGSLEHLRDRGISL